MTPIYKGLRGVVPQGVWDVKSLFLENKVQKPWTSSLVGVGSWERFYNQLKIFEIEWRSSPKTPVETKSVSFKLSKEDEPWGRGWSLIAVSRPASLTLSDGRGVDRWGWGGGGGGGSPSFSWTTGTRNQFQSVNLFFWECKNERFRQFNPTCMRYFLIHPKRLALFDLTF